LKRDVFIIYKLQVISYKVVFVTCQTDTRVTSFVSLLIMMVTDVNSVWIIK